MHIQLDSLLWHVIPNYGLQYLPHRQMVNTFHEMITASVMSKYMIYRMEKLPTGKKHEVISLSIEFSLFKNIESDV